MLLTSRFLHMREISILLGIIQGLTEFLPISSSGHLVLFEKIFHFDPPGLLFESLLHFGTLGSVVYLFRRRIWGLIKAPFTGGKNLRLLLFLFLATVPIGVGGIVFDKWIERAFHQLWVVTFGLWFTGLLLYGAHKVNKKERKLEEMSFLDSVCIGIMQIFSLLPGVSRSGATIAGGLFRGLDRELAAEFSFLLSIPAILGATVIKLTEAVTTPTAHHPYLFAYILGPVFSFLTGIIAIKTLLWLIQRRRLDFFAYYCWGMGLFIGIYFYLI